MSFLLAGPDLQTAGATCINSPCLDTGPTASRWQWSLPRPPRLRSAVAELENERRRRPRDRPSRGRNSVGSGRTRRGRSRSWTTSSARLQARDSWKHAGRSSSSPERHRRSGSGRRQSAPRAPALCSPTGALTAVRSTWSMPPTINCGRCCSTAGLFRSRARRRRTVARTSRCRPSPRRRPTRRSRFGAGWR